MTNYTSENRVLKPVYKYVRQEKLNNNGWTLPASINTAIACYIRGFTMEESRIHAKGVARTYKVLNYGLKPNNPLRKEYKMFVFVENVLSILTFLQSEVLVSKAPLFTTIEKQRINYAEEMSNDKE